MMFDLFSERSIPGLMSDLKYTKSEIHYGWVARGGRMLGNLRRNLNRALRADCRMLCKNAIIQHDMGEDD